MVKQMTCKKCGMRGPAGVINPGTNACQNVLACVHRRRSGDDPPKQQARFSSGKT